MVDNIANEVVVGGRNLENGDYGGLSVGVVIDRERIEQGVIRRDRDLVFVFVKRHIAKPKVEVDEDTPMPGCPVSTAPLDFPLPLLQRRNRRWGMLLYALVTIIWPPGVLPS